MKLRPMLSITGAIAVTAFVGFLIFQWVDCGVSLAYARDEQQHQRETIEVLRTVLRGSIQTGSFTRADLLHTLHGGLANGPVIEEHPDRIEVDRFVFRIRADRVTDVVFLAPAGRKGR